MPTTLATPGADIASVRWKEPYVSRGLNRKLYGIIGSGVVRGGKLVTTGAGFGVNIVPDPVDGDSIYSYQDVNDLQFTVRQEGIAPLNLTSVAGTTVYVCLYVGYTIGSDTVVEWRTYSHTELFTSPVAEAAFLIILGRVVVPGAGPIPAANITPIGRRMAWDDRAPNSWHQVVKNGNFERAFGAGNTGFFGIESWMGSGFGTPNFRISTSAPYEGTREFQLEQPSSGVVNTRLLIHERRVRVAEGMYVRARVRMRGSSWPGIAGGGHQGIALRFFTNDGAAVGSTVWIEDTALNGSFAYTLVDGVVAVPATAVWMRIYVGIDNNGASLGAGSIYFDDAKCWVEGINPIEDVLTENFLADTQAFESIAITPGGGLDSNTPATMAEYVERTYLQAKGSQVAGSPTLEQVVRLMRGQGLWRDNLLNGQIAFTGFAGTDQSEVPRAVMIDTVGDPRILFYEGQLNALTERVRIYLVRAEGIHGSGTGIEITTNARWDIATSLWMPDNSGGGARKSSKFVIANGIVGSFEMDMGTSVAAGWIDELTPDPIDSPRGWDYAPMMLNGGDIPTPPDGTGPYEVGAGKLVLENGAIHFYRPGTSESNPAATTVVAKNTLHAKNICKGWGKTETGVSHPTLMTILGGYNFAQARQLSANSHIVEITTATEVDDMVAHASINTLGVGIAFVQVTPTTFYLACWDSTTGAAKDVDSFVGSLNFTLHGLQT